MSLQLSISVAIVHLLVSIFAERLKNSTSSLDVASWVIFQAFDWDSLSDRGALYNTVSSMIPALHSAGIDAIWLPPPSQSVDKQAAGMVVIADVVINHRTAPIVDSCSKHYTSFADPVWGSWAVARDDETCIGASTGCCGNLDSGEGLTYAPDLDHTNYQVQSDVKSFLNFLRGLKFSVFSVGEYWDGSTALVTNWIDGTGGKSQAFDFPLRYILQAAIKSDDYHTMGYIVPGVLGRNPTHAVTFLDNHDTSRDDRFGSVDQIIMGYAYILTHPGTPCMYFEDWIILAAQSAIVKLIALRTAQGITSSSAVYIDKFTSQLYAAYINGNIAVKLGTASWQPSDSTFKIFTSGTNYAVWMK